MYITTKILKATANERRLRILLLLTKYNKLSVGKLADNLGITFAAVSRHLDKLEAVDLVKKEQRGLKIFYSLNYDKRKKFNNAFFEFLHKVKFAI